MSELPGAPATGATPTRSPIAPGRHHVHLSYVAIRTAQALKQIAIGLLAFGLATLPRIGDAPLVVGLQDSRQSRSW